MSVLIQKPHLKPNLPICDQTAKASISKSASRQLPLTKENNSPLSTLSRGSEEIDVSLSAQVMTIDVLSSASPANRTLSQESRASTHNNSDSLKEKSNRKPLWSALQGHMTSCSSSHHTQIEHLDNHCCSDRSKASFCSFYYRFQPSSIQQTFNN